MAIADDLERGMAGRAIRGFNQGLGGCVSHPFTKVGIGLAFLMYLYWNFLISIGKVSGVFDPDAQGESTMNHRTIPRLLVVLNTTRLVTQLAQSS